MLGVSLGASIQPLIAVTAALATFSLVSQWWRTSAGYGCACGVIGGGTVFISLGTARVCGTETVVCAQLEALSPGLGVAALIVSAATGPSRCLPFWLAALIAFGLVHVLVGLVAEAA